MAREQFANNPQSVLAAGVDGTTDPVTLTVQSASGFPTGPNFRIQVDREYLLVTAVAGTTFTAQRAVEGSAKAAHAVGAVVTHLLTAGALVQGVRDYAYSTLQVAGSAVPSESVLNLVGAAFSAGDDPGSQRTNVTLAQSPTASPAVVGTGRSIGTSLPLGGGGTLAADLQLTCSTSPASASVVVGTGRQIVAGGANVAVNGTTLANLSTDVTIAVGTTVASGGTLAINAGAALLVNGDATFNGKLVLPTTAQTTNYCLWVLATGCFLQYRCGGATVNVNTNNYTNLPKAAPTTPVQADLWQDPTSKNAVIHDGAAARKIADNVNLYLPTAAPASPTPGNLWLGASVPTYRDGGGNNQPLAFANILVGGSAQTLRPAVNLVAGAGVTLTPSDNSASNRLDVTIASGGGVTSVTATAPLTSSGGSTPNLACPTFGASGGSHSAGLVPDPGGTAGATKFLREDATWAVPSGGGGGGGTGGPNQQYSGTTTDSFTAVFTASNSNGLGGCFSLRNTDAANDLVYVLHFTDTRGKIFADSGSLAGGFPTSDAILGTAYGASGPLLANSALPPYVTIQLTVASRVAGQPATYEVDSTLG